MRIATIDVGSNSVHMIVCQVRPDASFEVVDREKDMIRLGAGAFDGQLPEANIAAALASLAKFRRLAESHGVDEIIVAATSAVREAENGTELITQARRQIGLRVRVISGLEEARLIHHAAAYAIGTGSSRAVVLDIGGGSTEVTLGTAARMESGRSFKLGAIRLAERFASSDPLSRRDEGRLVRYIGRETAAFLTQIRRRGFKRVIGTSGTIQALGALAIGATSAIKLEDVRRVAVPAADVSALRRALVGMTIEERLNMPGLDPRRADLAAVGAVLVDEILTRLRVDELTLCDFALREGLVLDYIKRNIKHIRTAERYPDVRRRSVIELAERCAYVPDHAGQVVRLSLALFDATRGRHGLGAREREWLEYGALLHDIGKHISYSAHHKHSQYLIRHGGLRGFDPDEVEIIGLLARYHRQGSPRRSHEGYGGLSRPRRRAVKWLSAMVRLAEGLDRSHGQVVRDLKLRTTPKDVRILLRVKSEAELEQWAADRHAAPLSRMLEAPVRFETLKARSRARSRGRRTGRSV